MADFYVDELFPEHPKAQFVGDDACWLYICGLAWAHRHNTPIIPKSTVPRLTTKKNHAALARKLATTAPGFTNPLWHERTDHYEIHDWSVRNAKSVARREHGKKAAEARWRNARAMPEHSPPNTQLAMPEHESGTCSEMLTQCLTNQGTKEPSSSSHRASAHPPPEPSSEDEDEELFDQAIAILAERDLANTTSKVGNRQAWLAEARRRRRNQHASQRQPPDGITIPEAFADLLDPPPVTPAAVYDEFEDRDVCPTCGTLDGRIDVNGTLATCPECLPAVTP